MPNVSGNNEKYMCIRFRKTASAPDLSPIAWIFPSKKHDRGGRFQRNELRARVRHASHVGILTASLSHAPDRATELRKPAAKPRKVICFTTPDSLLRVSRCRMTM